MTTLTRRVFMKKNKVVMLAGGVLAMVALLICPWLAGSSLAKAPAKPKMLVWASMDVGTAVYAQYSAVGEGILSQFGIKLRVVPVRASLARITLVRTGQASAAVFSAPVYFMWKGTEDFASRAWGPQKLRTMWLVGREYPSSAITTTKSGIKTVKDIKGKRVARYVGSPGLTALMEAVLAYANLTWKDVKPVDVGSYSEAINQMIAGKLDMCHGDAMSGKVVELAASPDGLYWIPLPVSDKEAWKRYQKVVPVYFPVQPKYGANIPKDNKTWYATSAYPTLYTYDKMSTNLAYWITKVVAESYPKFKDMIKPNMQWWAIDNFVKIPALVPYHKGTIKYLKERGLWSKEMAANQKALLAKEKKIQAAWNKAFDEAEKKKMPDKAFPKFWLKKLAEVDK